MTRVVFTFPQVANQGHHSPAPGTGSAIPGADGEQELAELLRRELRSELALHRNEMMKLIRAELLDRPAQPQTGALPRSLRPKQAAALLGEHTRWIYAHKDALGVTKHGGRLWVPQDRVDEELERRRGMYSQPPQQKFIAKHRRGPQRPLSSGDSP